MFTYEEIVEINTLCEENELFAKYVNKFKDENDRLLSKITHELGNPLTLINSTAQLIEMKNPEISEIKYWDQLRNDIDSLRELFLTVSKYRYSSKLECIETDLIDLADETVESFQAVAAEKNVSVTLEESDETDVTLFAYVCDTVKIRQAMVNLIKNALEAVDVGGKVWVRVLGTGKTPSGCVRIEISNDGELIPGEKIKEIFDFSVSTKGENRGMGLPIAKKIVESHKGVLEVSSEEIDGERKTTFSICLPA